jgi:hypothetical protein
VLSVGPVGCLYEENGRQCLKGGQIVESRGGARHIQLLFLWSMLRNQSAIPSVSGISV